MAEKEKVYFVRVQEDTYKRIGAMADAEMRSINSQANLLLKNALDFAAQPPMMVVPANHEIIPPIPPEKKSRSASRNSKKVPKIIEPVNSCPHGYAIGMCKKVDCNKKFQRS